MKQSLLCCACVCLLLSNGLWCMDNPQKNVRIILGHGLKRVPVMDFEDMPEKKVPAHNTPETPRKKVQNQKLKEAKFTEDNDLEVTVFD